MTEEIDRNWREGWTGRWFLYACGLALAATLIFGAGLSWPFALGAGLTVVLAGFVVRLRPKGRAPLEETLLARRAARLTDLTVEGLMAAMPVPAVLLDPKLVVRTHNAAATRLLPGLRRGEPLMLFLRAPEVVDVVRRALAANTPQVIDYQERVPVARWFGVDAVPVAITSEARDGVRPDYILMVLRDLTEERRLERLRADFVANASHELRTPLASVLGFIETIQGPARNDSAARDRFLDIMLTQARRMSRLIDDLLSLSRVELNEHVRPTDIVDLVSLIAQLRDTLAQGAADQGVTIEIVAAEAALRVRGDADELFRLFENLVQNAVKYGGSGGRVVVSLDAEGRDGRPTEAVVTVRDFGPGIAAEHLPRLTERFYRVDVASSRDKGGTGLGLALVKHIVNRHRGKLAIASTPGEGAAFTVRLELATDETAPATVPPDGAGPV